jgi:hypothetical protein
MTKINDLHWGVSSPTMWVEGRGEAFQLEVLLKKEFFKLGVKEGAKTLTKAQVFEQVFLLSKAKFKVQQLGWVVKPETYAWRLEALQELLVA